MSEKRTEQIRTQRNLMLSNLTSMYPGSIEGEKLYLSILGVFPDCYDRRSCVKDLYYLEEKGYVVRKNPRTGKADPQRDWKVAWWAATAKGNEVGNNLVLDPALEV
jgi:hypothetical protein